MHLQWRHFYILEVPGLFSGDFEQPVHWAVIPPIKTRRWRLYKLYLVACMRPHATNIEAPGFLFERPLESKVWMPLPKLDLNSRTSSANHFVEMIWGSRGLCMGSSQTLMSVFSFQVSRSKRIPISLCKKPLEGRAQRLPTLLEPINLITCIRKIQNILLNKNLSYSQIVLTRVEILRISAIRA